MAVVNQLEIINPSGEITFYDLDPQRNVANIGRDPDNHIVIDDPYVSPFHAVLDYGQKPYHIVILSPEGETKLGGQPLSPNIPTEFRDRDALELAGYALILLERTGAAEGPPGVGAIPAARPRVPAPPRPGEKAPTRPAERGTAITPYQEAPLRAPTPYPDLADDIIIAELSEREWTVDVEQAATCQVTLTNGGDIVASFVVRVEGVPEEWVTLSPPQVNLNEGERTTVAVAITPPRLPSSRAGTHHIAVVVTSPNHFGRSCQRSATLVINPYYEFAVGELSPRQQTLGGRKPSAETVIHIANKGNSVAPFRLEAMDDARALNFEFKVPGETTTLARQAEMRLPPEETFAIPIHITPLSRPLVGLRKRNHSFTVTASILEGALTPRSLLGQLMVKPLIGPPLLALFSLILVAIVLLVFRPRVYDFQAEPSAILAGETVTLSWRASRFSSLSLETDTGEILPPIENSATQLAIQPEKNVTYFLKADNLLSALLPPLSRLRDARKESQVIVDPVYPTIRVFTADRNTVLTSENINLRWEVLNADEVILSINGNEEKLLSTENTGDRSFPAVQNPPNCTLRATNRYGFDTDSVQITVLNPTPTPLPPPVIRKFMVTPLSITEGQTVTVQWEVDGATKVSISNLNQQYPPVGSTLHTPPATTDYVLTAFFEAEGKSVTTVSIPVTVIVNPKPTPTPEPQKPEISYFNAEPAFVVKGTSTQVNLFWLVTGETTNIEMAAPALGITFSNLDAKGQLLVTVEDATSFILTAHNKDLSASKTVQLASKDPTPTPVPLPIIDYFVLDESSPNVIRLSSDPANNIINYQVAGGSQVTFKWSAQLVSNVTLWADGMSLGEYPPVGSTPRMIMSQGQYQLSAENAAGQIRYAYIHITLKPVTPPEPPFNVSGTQAMANQPFTVTWQFDPGAYAGVIPGFRIYRAAVPYADYNEFTLVGEVRNPIARDWREDPGNVCDLAYFVRAIYIDEFGQEQVTRPSNIWHTFPCSP